MTHRSQVFLRQAVAFLDLVVVVAAFTFSYYLRQHVHQFYRWDLVRGREVLDRLVPFSQYTSLLLIILPAWLIAIDLQGGYQSLRTRTVGSVIWKLVKAELAGFVALVCAVFLFKLHYVSRTFLLTFLGLSFSFLVFERMLVIYGSRLVARWGYFRYRVLVVGTGPRARNFVRTMRHHSADSVEVVGWVDQVREIVGHTIDGIPVVGVLEQLPELLPKLVVDEVAFVVPRAWLSRIESSILECELRGLKTTVAADLFNMRFARATPVELEGIPLLTFETTPHEQWALACKRITDLLVALIGLGVLSPLLAVVPLVIKLTSPGSILYRQQRVGLNGRAFILYKFRTMVTDAEQRQAELQALNEMDGPVFKITNDPRLTRVGRWLRRFSVDELPQLWNVLKGEMSLVGPRPPLPSEVVRYEPWQRRRLSMRPGLTCLWQVNGRNRIPFKQWMELDLQYIDRWSLSLDLTILLKTVPAVFSGAGAK